MVAPAKWCNMRWMTLFVNITSMCHNLTNEFYNTNLDTFKSNDIDICTSNITKHTYNTSKKHIPNKIVKIRQSDPKWSDSNIKRVLREIKRLYHKSKAQVE